MTISRASVALLAAIGAFAPAIARADTAEDISYTERQPVPAVRPCRGTLLTIERNVREIQMFEARSITIDEEGNVQLSPVAPPEEMLTAETRDRE